MRPARVETRGRPYFVATMPFQNHRKTELLDEFYTILATFRYREVMAVSRALGVSPRTIERWKYRETFPRWDTALTVIEWHKQGRPVQRRLQRQSKRNLM